MQILRRLKVSRGEDGEEGETKTKRLFFVTALWEHVGI